MPTSQKQHISYKPAAVARRKTTDTNQPSGAIDFPPDRLGMQRLHITIPPGTELTVDFGLAKGHVRLGYPLDQDPYALVDLGDESVRPVTFTFERSRVARSLMEGRGEG
jgi:hypothetical protein